MKLSKLNRIILIQSAIQLINYFDYIFIYLPSNASITVLLSFVSLVKLG